MVVDIGFRQFGDVLVPNGGGWEALTGYIQIAPSHQDYGLRRYYKLWEESDVPLLTFTGTLGAEPARCVVTELSDGLTAHVTDSDTVQVDSPNPVFAGTVTTTIADSLLLGTIVVAHNVSPSVPEMDADSPAAEIAEAIGDSRVPMWAGYYITASTGSKTLSATRTTGGLPRGYGGILTAFVCTSGSACPASGKPNQRPEVVTMTGADGTTSCPFGDGTLHVFVDATEQTATLVSQDGATGDFTLGFDPTPTEVVTVEYLGR